MKLYSLYTNTFKRILHTFESTMDIKTFIFCDCETTGLPSMEQNKTKITELCFTLVESEHINLGVFPRVQPKLNFCFNPRRFINPQASNITGLYNDLLENQPEFDLKVVTLIQQFLDLHKGPACLVAHNGKQFDYPILRKHISDVGFDLSDDLLCIDTLEAFRSLHITEETKCDKEMFQSNTNKLEKNIHVPFEFSDEYDDILNDLANKIDEEMLTTSRDIKNIQQLNENTPKKQIISHNSSELVRAKLNFSNKVIVVPHSLAKKKLNYGVSFKLGDIYKRLTEKDPVKSHKAEGDVDMLIECAATLGEKFTNWANENAVKFADIPLLGKRIANKNN